MAAAGTVGPPVRYVCAAFRGGWADSQSAIDCDDAPFGIRPWRVVAPAEQDGAAGESINGRESINARDLGGGSV